MTEQQDAFFASVMGLAASAGWRRLALSEIAEAAGMSLADLKQTYGGKNRILGAFADHIDEKMLRGPEEEGSPRDRLFDVLMRRFDALGPYKDGLAVIVREGGGGGVCAALCAGQRLLRSMAWALEAAGISSGGVVGAVRAKGLAAVYASTFMTWLRDDTEDKSRTMSSLDSNLARAERFANMMPGRRRRAEPDSEPDTGGASGFGAPPAGEPGPSTAAP